MIDASKLLILTETQRESVHHPERVVEGFMAYLRMKSSIGCRTLFQHLIKVHYFLRLQTNIDILYPLNTYLSLVSFFSELLVETGPTQTQGNPNHSSDKITESIQAYESFINLKYK